MSLTRDQKKKSFLVFEQIIGPTIEDELIKRMDQLANTPNDRIVFDFIQLNVIRKAVMRNNLLNISQIQLQEWLEEYIDAQIYLVQSVSLERDLLTLSQFVRQYYGIDQSIYLLENIHKPDFEIDFFSQLPRDIQTTVHRIQNFYDFAETKKSFYVEAMIKEEESYKKLCESLMWINGQRRVCIAGMKSIRDQAIPKVAVTEENKNVKATIEQGARAHLQATLGTFIEEELENLSDSLASVSVEDIVNSVKSKPTYEQFHQSLGNNTRAGFNTYVPNKSTQELYQLIDEYLNTSVHLVQSISHERDLIKISQYIRQHYGIETSIKLLTDIEKPDFSLAAFFQYVSVPSNEVACLIENIHRFYTYLSIKRHDGFFDPEEPQAKKLFESEMWLGLQRRCCIEGMSLIHSGEVYQHKQIGLDHLNQPLKAVVRECKEEPANKKQRTENVSMASSSSSSSSRDLSDRLDTLSTASSSTFFSSIPRPSLSNNFSILGDALIVLDKLKQKAMLMQSERNYSAPYYGTSAENDRMYPLTHGSNLTLQDSGLTKERFYAISELIETAVREVSEKPLCRNYLRVYARQGTEDIEIYAQYHPHWLAQQRNTDIEGLPAPIAKVPFDEMRWTMDMNTKNAFDHWQVSPSDSQRLVREFSNAREKDYCFGRLYDIERACKELHRNFSLNLENDFLQEGTISLNKNHFERAQAMVLPNNNFNLERANQNDSNELKLNMSL